MRLATVIAALAMVAAACGSTDGSLPSSTDPGSPPTTGHPGPIEEFAPGDVATVDLPLASSAVSAAQIAAVVAADNEFGLDLFTTVAGDENLMVSPYSIATALSMLYPGARGTTANEIAAVLHTTVDDETLHAVRNHLNRLLATPSAPMGDSDTREPFTIRPANSAWGQGGYPFLDDYLRVLAESYGAGLRLLDYAGDPDGSRAIINAWVEDTTEDRIKDLIPDGAIDPLTRLVLVNAIWFKANWFEQFDPSRTTTGAFVLLDGSEIDVPMMHAGQRTGYASNDLFEAVRLPYAGDAAMVVLLPKQGSPADLAEVLQPEDLDIRWGDFQVDLSLPSFEFEAEIALKTALQELGIKAAFAPPSTGPEGADLTGITEARELYVSEAFHKSFIALDEEGTEAAAATALIMSLESMPQPATFTADRPFLFWIEHSSTGEILFLGQVTNPS